MGEEREVKMEYVFTAMDNTGEAFTRYYNDLRRRLEDSEFKITRSSESNIWKLEVEPPYFTKAVAASQKYLSN